jgi:hypothetical protein
MQREVGTSQCSAVVAVSADWGVDFVNRSGRNAYSYRGGASLQELQAWATGYGRLASLSKYTARAHLLIAS